MKRCHQVSALMLIVVCCLPVIFGKPAVPDRTPQTSGWPMFGGTPARNLVNPREKNLPTTWSLEAGKHVNIKWVAHLGDRTFGSPVVADGVVYMGSNGNKLNASNSGQSILYALRETDGSVLWKITHDKPPADHNLHQLIRGLFSTPTVDGNRVYYVSPLSEVICADSANGKILWRYDMVRELKVSQNEIFVCPAFQFNGNLCAPLVVGDFVYVVTCNGADDEGRVAAPNAPSFVALHKKTGEFAWASNLPGEKIILANWSNPAFAVVQREPQVIFAGGDGVVYSFEPATGKLVWKCDCLPFRGQMKPKGDNYFVGTPVIVEDRLYIGLGSYPEGRNVRNDSYFLCLDITKRGDVSFKSFDHTAKENKNSALVWAFGGRIMPAPKSGPDFWFHNTASTAAVHDGLVYIPDELGYFHCLDAKTGSLVWRHDLQSNIWGSPLWADGRVFLGATDGTIHILAHGRTKKLLATVDMDESIETTPTAMNGVLYVATRSKLYAIQAR
jgi:outer membrane protein assembly factor BamB